MSALKVVTKNFDRINPRSLSSYLDCDGLGALRKAVGELGPEGVIETVKNSSLLGRGGAGFPTGKKWEIARTAGGKKKYLIANADEGEPGTFKDRYLLGSDPFMLLEGMAIAAFAVGAKQAYIYLRAEYEHISLTITNAIRQIEQKLSELYRFDVGVYLGAGAYICGEETALIESLEGKRGDARFRPPFPPVEGLWQKPTVVNNVETLMNVPQIILNGADWFKKMGTEKSKGTKVFSVSGDVERPGVYELELGSRLSELLGLAGARETKMVQLGGASGRLLPQTKLDVPLAYETVLGAGGVIVLEQSRDAVEVAFKTMEFFREESCGKCTPCREGTRVCLEILERFQRNAGTEKDLLDLEALSRTMNLASLCGLGQTAPNVVTDTLENFRGEYLSRMNNQLPNSKHQTK